MGHHARSGDGDIELDGTPACDLFGKLFATNDVGSGFLSLGDCLAVHECGDPDVLAGPVGETDRTTHQLVGLAGVDAKIEHRIDALVELGEREAADELEGVFRAVEDALVELTTGCRHIL